MPYPRHFSFKKWKECRRCGLDYPKQELRRDSFGVDICPQCIDEDGHDEHLSRMEVRGEEVREDVEDNVI
jgi:hypothetical protein